MIKQFFFSSMAYLFFQISLSAQQLPLFTQYREYYGYINPASVATDAFVSEMKAFNAFGISHRQQWVNPSFPTISTSVARGELFFTPNGGLPYLLGGYLMTDKAGATGINSFHLRGAIYQGDPTRSFFGVGFTAGGISFNINTSTLKTVEPDPHAIINIDAFSPSLGFGIFGVLKTNQNINFFGGISMPQVFGSDIRVATPNGNFRYERINHYFNYAGMYINTSINNDDYSFIELSTWGKYVPGLPYHADFLLRYQITDPFWLGAGYSTTRNIHLEAGFNIPTGNGDGRFKIGYGYDFPFNSDFGQHLGATHEVNLSFIIDKQ